MIEAHVGITSVLRRYCVGALKSICVGVALVLGFGSSSSLAFEIAPQPKSYVWDGGVLEQPLTWLAFQKHCYNPMISSGSPDTNGLAPRSALAHAISGWPLNHSGKSLIFDYYNLGDTRWLTVTFEPVTGEWTCTVATSERDDMKSSYLAASGWVSKKQSGLWAGEPGVLRTENAYWSTLDRVPNPRIMMSSYHSRLSFSISNQIGKN